MLWMLGKLNVGDKVWNDFQTCGCKELSAVSLKASPVVRQKVFIGKGSGKGMEAVIHRDIRSLTLLVGLETVFSNRLGSSHQQ